VAESIVTADAKMTAANQKVANAKE